MNACLKFLWWVPPKIVSLLIIQDVFSNPSKYLLVPVKLPILYSNWHSELGNLFQVGRYKMSAQSNARIMQVHANDILTYCPIEFKNTEMIRCKKEKSMHVDTMSFNWMPVFQCSRKPIHTDTISFVCNLVWTWEGKINSTLIFAGYWIFRFPQKCITNWMCNRYFMVMGPTPIWNQLFFEVNWWEKKMVLHICHGDGTYKFSEAKY